MTAATNPAVIMEIASSGEMPLLGAAKMPASPASAPPRNQAIAFMVSAE